MIGILDYGLGNVRAFANIYKLLNIQAAIVSDASQLRQASRLIIPGVGAFDDAMDSLERSGMREALDEFALDRRVPVLGVCVGMQMLTASSDEGVRPGLGWVPGNVVRFSQRAGEHALAVPHMGWNDVRPLQGEGLFDGLQEHARFYFLHSYYVACDDAHTLATADYGEEFVCAVNHRNIFGVQFHPEKSHQHGIRLLRNFATL